MITIGTILGGVFLLVMSISVGPALAEHFYNSTKKDAPRPVPQINPRNGHKHRRTNH